MTLVFISALVIVSCKSVPKFSEVTGKEWLLKEIRTQGGVKALYRSDIVRQGFNESIFSLVLDAERISGMGAPNRYFAPYTLGKKQSITIQNIAGTLMAPLFELDVLKEHEYYTYLQNVYEWNLVNGQLELYSKNTTSSSTSTLVFVQN